MAPITQRNNTHQNNSNNEYKILHASVCKDGCLSALSIAVIKTLTKTTWRGNDLLHVQFAVHH